MNVISLRRILLKLLLLPVILCSGLMIAQTQAVISYGLFLAMFFYLHEDLRQPEVIKNTIVDRKVRMNN